MVLIRVDLPQPFGPRIATCSPAPMLSVMSWSTRLAAQHHGNAVEGQQSGSIGCLILIRYSRFESILANMLKSAAMVFAIGIILLRRVRAIGLEFDHGQRFQERHSAAGSGDFFGERPVGHQHWSRRRAHGAAGIGDHGGEFLGREHAGSDTTLTCAGRPCPTLTLLVVQSARAYSEYQGHGCEL